MAFYKSYLRAFTTPEEITPQITGTTSCSCYIEIDNMHDNNRWIQSSGSATCYAELVNAVGDITITISGSGRRYSGDDDYSYGWSANATFNGITASKSGSGSFTINVGDTPVSGTLTINLSCSAAVRSYRVGDFSQASCSLTTVKYNQSKGIIEKLPYFKS